MAVMGMSHHPRFHDWVHVRSTYKTQEVCNHGCLKTARPLPTCFSRYSALDLAFTCTSGTGPYISPAFTQAQGAASGKNSGRAPNLHISTVHDFPVNFEIPTICFSMKQTSSKYGPKVLNILQSV